MKNRSRLYCVAALAAFSLAWLMPSALGQPAFPGALGFGATATGGRGGIVVKVTNRDDSGPGSLRAALLMTVPRIIVFPLQGAGTLHGPGEIRLQSQIAMGPSNGNVTIAGQTAPGGGITVRKDPSVANFQMPLKIACSNVIMRYMRFRPGIPTTGTPPTNNNLDAVDLGDDIGTVCSGIIVDHCSFSWSVDELFTVSAQNVTLSWNIFSEPLDNSIHNDGRHSKGVMFVQGAGPPVAEPNSDCDNISMHHNLLAHCLDRNPVINSSGVVDLVNNVFYNAIAWTQVKNKWATAQANIVKNYYKQGPDYVAGAGTYKQSINGWEVIMARDTGGSTLHPQAYLLGNIGWHRPTDTGAQTLIVRTKAAYPYNIEDDWLDISTTRFAAPSLGTAETSATAAYTAMIDTALGKGPGSNLRLKSTSPYDLTINSRDSVDARIITEVTNGTGAIKNSVPGWATMASGGVATDADGDGMPDAWEAMHVVSSPTAVKTAGGYTNIECYINGTIP